MTPRRSLALGLVFLAVGLAAPAWADGGPRAGSISCVHIQAGVVTRIGTSRVDTGSFRCSAGVTVARRGSTDLIAALRVLQAIDGGDRLAEPQGAVDRTFALWRGFKGGVELELAVPETLNGCMPYVLEVRFGGARTRVKARPACND